MNTPVTPPTDLDAMLKRLNLPTVRRLCPELARRAKGESMPNQNHSRAAVPEEIAHRAETRMRRAVHASRFRFVRTIDDFSLTFQASLRRQMLGTYLGLDLVSDGRIAIFSGPSGLSKPHPVCKGDDRPGRDFAAALRKLQVPRPANCPAVLHLQVQHWADARLGIDERRQPHDRAELGLRVL